VNAQIRDSAGADTGFELPFLTATDKLAEAVASYETDPLLFLPRPRAV
jgi:hypothetical protein